MDIDHFFCWCIQRINTYTGEYIITYHTVEDGDNYTDFEWIESHSNNYVYDYKLCWWLSNMLHAISLIANRFTVRTVT